MTESFRTAVREVEEYEWQVLRRRVGDYLVDAGQEYAEVCFVPNWIGHRKSGAEYRFIAIRGASAEAVTAGNGVSVGDVGSWRWETRAGTR